jgi:tetratricopeptide (TPR) repeat protein
MTIDYYNKAIEIYQDILPYTDSKIIHFYYQIAISYQTLENFDRAIQYFKNTQERLEMQEEKDFLKLADVHSQIGFCFCNIEDWNSSINYCFMALGLYRSIEIYSTALIYRLCITIAHCFGQQEMYNSAIEYFEQALEMQEDKNNHDTKKKSEIIHLNNQLGFCYYMSAQYDIAYGYYEKSIETARNSSFYIDHFSMTDNYEMMANIYVHYNEKILARHCLNKALKLLKDTEPITSVKLKRVRNLLKNL